MAGGHFPEGPSWASTSDGYRLLASTQAAGIPTILVSGVASASEIQHAHNDYGAFACLEKQTLNRNDFLRTIDELLSTQRTKQSLGNLTERELQVLKLFPTGMTNQEITDKLMISKNTVKRHLKAVFEKSAVRTRSAAAATAAKADLSSGWTPDVSHG